MEIDQNGVVHRHLNVKFDKEYYSMLLYLFKLARISKAEYKAGYHWPDGQERLILTMERNND